ncbi:MAG: hypothetical protein N3D11_00525 [Candidatus Sumerlaeia bacterium]|nr:hypothetical protein [Candidatus Sumerlaeia bacterium]
MSLMKETLRNIAAFFRWIAEFYRTWFLPYHYDGDDEDVEAEKTEETVAATADHAPDRSPKPSPPPEPEPAAGAATVSEAPPAEAEAAVESLAAGYTDRLVQAMAFRGAVSTRALSAIVGVSPEKVAELLKPLVESQKAIDLGSGRYVLAGSERKSVLRADGKIAEWLARFHHADTENRVLDAIDRLCRELPLRLYMGKDLFFQLRRRTWMLWQSGRKGCRVRLYGTLNPAQWRAVQEADHRARQFRQAGFHPYRERDCTLFLWRSEEQFSKIAAFLPESALEFLRQTKRRRPSKPGASDEEDAGETAEVEETNTDSAEMPEETAASAAADEAFERTQD